MGVEGVLGKMTELFEGAGRFRRNEAQRTCEPQLDLRVRQILTSTDSPSGSANSAVFSLFVSTKRKNASTTSQTASSKGRPWQRNFSQSFSAEPRPNSVDYY